VAETTSLKIENPYGSLKGGRWLKGNLHAHTTNSDGKASPQEVLDRYAELGHDFLMISDHDIYTSAEDHAKWDAKGLILIPGNEISRNGPHVLHVNANRKIEPDALRQRVISQAVAAGGFIIVAHPNWQGAFDHCSIQKMSEWIDYTGMEIYNGVISRLDGSPYATNKWDILLTADRRIWGFANDDSHRPETDIGLGWNVAYVTDESVNGVVEALSAGRFYGSTGVEITDIKVTGNRIRIATRNARRVVALQQVGKRIAVADSNEIEVEVPENAKYVRFECWGDGEQFAWTQPFYCSGGETK
jgi:hypothetical protein